MKSYIALVRKEGTRIEISFPDLPGCRAEGETIEAARASTSHALAAHLQELVQSGSVIPAPSSIAEVVASPLWQADKADAIILAIRPVPRSRSPKD